MHNVVYKFDVPNAACSSCKEVILQSIATTLEENSDIQFLSYTMSLNPNILELHLGENSILDADAIMKRLNLEAIGFSIYPIDASDEEPPKSQLNYWGAGFGLGLGAFLMIASLGVFPILFSFPFLLLSSGILSVLAWPFVQKAWNHFYLAIKYEKYQNIFNMDALFVLTGLLIIVSSLLSLWFPVFPILLEAGFMIFGFRHLGCIVQAYLDEQMAPTRSLLDLCKNQLFYLEAKKEQKCGKYLEIGTSFWAKEGDIIPVNGRIIQRTPDASLRDILRAGSYGSIEDNENVEAGTEVMEGEVLIEVTADLMHSRLATIDSAVQEIRNRQKPAEILLKAEQWLQWFIPGLFLLALVSGIWIGQVFGLAMALNCVAAILVSACPCTLGFIVPMSLQMGAYKAQLHQLSFQNSEAIQLAAEAQIVVVDYNGTLTEGAHQVSDFQLTSEVPVDLNRCYQIIDKIESCMLEKRPHHQIGEMVKAKTTQKLAEHEALDIEIEKFQDYGYGAHLLTCDGEWWFGNHQILNKEINNAQALERAPQRLYLLHRPKENNELLYLGHFNLQDNLRDNAQWFLENLVKKGKKVQICTGADKITAEYIAQTFSIDMDDIQAEQSPEDKALFIGKLRENYPDKVIAMIGDGVNDCEALEASDIKIWLKNDNQSEFFQEFMQSCANVIVSSSDLLGIAHAFEIADQTFLAIEQNLWISFAYNVCMLTLACGALLALGFAMHPAIGACMMIVQSACLVWNNYRISQLPVENLSTLTANC